MALFHGWTPAYEKGRAGAKKEDDKAVGQKKKKEAENGKVRKPADGKSK